MLLIVVLTAGTSAYAQDVQQPHDTLFVSDRFIIDTTTTGAVIIAKFRTAKERTDLVNLEAVVDSSTDRSWLFQDILVTLDINGNGWVAFWQVAGPRRIIEAHLARIRDLARNRRVIYDHDIRLVAVRCACS